MAGAIRHITENGCGYWRSTMSLQDIAAGVPQGSVLDPYTFSPLYSIFFCSITRFGVGMFINDSTTINSIVISSANETFHVCMLQDQENL